LTKKDERDHRPLKRPGEENDFLLLRFYGFKGTGKRGAGVIEGGCSRNSLRSVAGDELFLKGKPDRARKPLRF